MSTPGWYPDPLDRFDLRFHNGAAWTADVSTGGDRFVDPLGVSTPPPGERQPSSAATAAMVLGIIAVSTAWMPFLVVVGLATAVLALALGIPALRRAGPTGSGRGRAIAGVAMGASAVAASAIGILLSVIVLDVYDDYLTPGPHEVAVISCDVAGSRATMTGELTNLGAASADYSIQVGFYRSGTNSRHAVARTNLDAVDPESTVEFEVQHQIDLDEVDCRVLDVNGPLPFGLSLD